MYVQPKSTAKINAIDSARIRLQAVKRNEKQREIYMKLFLEMCSNFALKG